MKPYYLYIIKNFVYPYIKKDTIYNITLIKIGNNFDYQKYNINDKLYSICRYCGYNNSKNKKIHLNCKICNGRLYFNNAINKNDKLIFKNKDIILSSKPVKNHSYHIIKNDKEFNKLIYLLNSYDCKIDKFKICEYKLNPKYIYSTIFNNDVGVSNIVKDMLRNYYQICQKIDNKQISFEEKNMIKYNAGYYKGYYMSEWLLSKLNEIFLKFGDNYINGYSKGFYDGFIKEIDIRKDESETDNLDYIKSDSTISDENKIE